jgi:MFS family permease
MTRLEVPLSSITPDPGAGSSANSGWTPRLAVSLISLLCLVESAAWANVGTITALPRIINYFHTTQGGWLLTSGLLAGAAGAPLIGKLADLFGKRRMLLICAIVAIVGEIVGATAQAFWVLIVAQILILTLTGFLFLCYSLIRDVYPKNLVSFAASVSVTGMGVLLVGAPFLIGALLDHYGFRSLYVFNVIWLVVWATVAMLTTPETPVRRASRIDVPGALLLGGGLALILLPVSQGSAWGWDSARVIGLLIGGAAVLAAYVLVSLRVREPVLNLRILVRWRVLLGVLGGGMGNGLAPVLTTILALLAMTPRMLGVTYGLGYSATKYAWLSAPFSLLSVVGGLLVGLLVRRFGARLLLFVGLAFLGVGALLLMFEHDTFGKILGACIVMGLGFGFSVAASPNLIIAGTPVAEQGSMSSAGGVSAGAIGAIMNTVIFAIMTPTAKSPLPGVIVYGDSGIKRALLAVALVAFATLLVGALFLRPRASDEVESLTVTATPEASAAV